MSLIPLAVLAGSAATALYEAATATPAARARPRFAEGAFAVGLGAWLTLQWLDTRDVSLARDRSGIAFAHDLVLPTPDRSLVLLSGDEPGSAALFVCAIEKACEDRIVISPGSLFLPWRMAQVRRRHPDLAIPWSSGPALAHTHELVAASIRDRPVFVYPDLLVKDPLLLSLRSQPDHLLYRILPNDADGGATRAGLLASAAAMAARGVHLAPSVEGCDGCGSYGALPFRPSQDVQLVRAYQAAIENHLRLIPEANELTFQLHADVALLAGEVDTQGWASISR